MGRRLALRSESRFTATRAVSGFLPETIQRAKPSRLAGAPGGRGWNAAGTPAVTRSPKFRKFPLRWTKVSRRSAAGKPRRTGVDTCSESASLGLSSSLSASAVWLKKA